MSKPIEEQLDEYKDSLIDVLYQETGSIDRDNMYIDDHGLSAYEHACAILERDRCIKSVKGKGYKVLPPWDSV